MKVKYRIYNPAGNITALVIGDEYSVEQRKIINDVIMKEEPSVEQVGFVSLSIPKLTMAGGEFCGNATRCAAAYYLENKEIKEIEINNQNLQVGIDDGKIWCEIPIEEYKIDVLDNKSYKVVLKGITILIVKDIKDYSELKQKAKNLMKYYNTDDDAVGVIFTKKIEEYIKIYPIVWVKSIDTLFFENACGSGTTAVTMVETYLTKQSNKYRVKQPSGEFLETDITIKNNRIIKAILKGKIESDNKIREFVI